MNYMGRLAALLLALLILMSALPLTAFAEATYGGPTADPEELVVDYGKGVIIEEANLKKHIHLNGGATKPTLVGLTDNDTYTNGQILSATPAGMGCTTASSSMDTTYGKLTRTSNRLTYTPTKFLTGIEYFWAVYSFTGYSNYLLVEIRIIPAPQIYYEAEDFVTNQIETIHTTDGGKTNVAWGLPGDDTNTGTTTQSFEQVGDADFDMTVDYKHIPSGAFFADFDGTGDEERYASDTIYGGCDFDSKECWMGSSGQDSDYIDLTPGHLVIPVTAKDYHYVQTTVTNKNGESFPLAFVPSQNDFLEVRFRTEGVKGKYVPPDSTAPNEPRLQMKLGTDRTLAEGELNVAGDALQVELDYDALKAGEYITARVPLVDWDDYVSAKIIYKFRFYVNGILFNTGGKLIIDYIYMGSTTATGVPNVTQGTRNYLFFGFDKWTDAAYYGRSTYDGDKDYSDKTNWYSDIYSCGANGSGKLDLNTDGFGTMSFTDPSDYDDINGLQFAGTNPLSYPLNGTDYFKIRFKITGGYGTPGLNLDIKIGGSWKYINKPDYVPTLTRGDQWQEVIFRLSDRSITSGTITDLRVWFTNTQGCTFTIDYFAVFPAELLTTTKDYLYMDFGADSAELFYSTEDLAEKYSDEYGTGASRGFDKFAYFHPKAKVSLTKSSEGLVMEDTTPTAGESEKGDDTRVYFWGDRVSFTPKANHYFQARIKIERASGASVVKFTDTDGGSGPWFDFYFKNSANGGYYVTNEKDRWPIDLERDIGRWITVTIPLRHSDYNTSNPITRIVPALRGTQGAKVTFDYIYIGKLRSSGGTSTYDPSVEANPAARALYFGFDNDQQDKDRFGTSKYRSNDTYCGLNYDTGDNWVTSDYYSDSTSAFTVNNTNGIVALAASTKDVDGKTKGPYFVTTNKKGSFVVHTDAQKSLKYHPQYAEIFQIRFRLNGCTIDTPADKKPELIFLFGGYAKTGDYTYHEHKETYPYMTQQYHDTDEFQTVTIAVPKAIRNMTLITNFGVRFWRIKGGTIDIDYIYLGPSSGVSHSNAGTGNVYAGAEIYAPYDAVVSDTVYGYDESYTDDTLFSNGKSMFVEGKGVRTPTDPNPAKYTEASFSFTGTGFDLISCTGEDQGMIRVEVRNTADGKVVRSMSVNNKGDLELYQIPVVSIQGLVHGSYTVTIGINAGVENVVFPFLNRGDDFYLDGIRIYDTINVKGGNATGSNLSTEQKIALNAYRLDKEAFAYVREIRDSLLTASDFSSGKYHTNGALFVDTVQFDGEEWKPEYIQVNPNLALNVATYNHMGPKNEVYLSPGQAVAFKLNYGTGTPVSIDIGAKSVLSTDGSAILEAGFVSSVDLSKEDPASITTIVKNINTATPLYYELDASSAASGSYLVLYNAHTGTDKTKNILSLTDLKICYDFEPSNLPTEGQDEIYPSSEEKTATRGDEAVSEPFRFEVDERVTEAIALFLNSVLETPVDEEAPAEEELTIYHSLNLASDISVNYLVPVEELEGYDDFYMSVAVSEYEGNELEGHRFVYPEAVKNGDYYYFTLWDMDATRMNDVLEATVYMTKDGIEYRSVRDIYSVADYAYNQLSKAGASESLKTLCANLLNYGTAAQSFKGYRTDAPANAIMTEAERAYCTDPASVTFGNINTVLNDVEQAPVTWVGKSLNLGSKVELKFVFGTGTYEGELADLTLRISYTDAQGSPKTVILKNAELYNEAKGYYAFTLDSLLAAELRTVISAQIYSGDTPVSATLQYSPDTYGNNKTGTLLDLCKALFAYSDSAKAYFAP